jgi:anti-sigma B factor antagonist
MKTDQRSREGEAKVEISRSPMKRCELVAVSGEVDSASAPELEEALQGLIAEGIKNLVVNLSQVSFMSSAGLKALISAQMKVRRMIPAGEVVLSETPPFLRETLELVGFHHVFTFYDDDVLAVGSF